MRRSEREVKDAGEIRAFLDRQSVLRIGFADSEGTYIVPVNYAYEADGDKLTFWFHSAGEGRKAEAIKSGLSEVFFEIDGDHEPVAGEGCHYTMKFMSIMGKAGLSVVEDTDEKIKALAAITGHLYPERAPFSFEDMGVQLAMVVRLDVREYSCKRNNG